MEHLGQFIINHWILWSAFIVIAILIIINELLSPKKQAKQLTPAAAVALMNHENATVVDIREAEAFRQGHIINAILATPEDFNKDRLKQYLQKPIILVCAKGLQSPALASKLRAQGYRQIMVLSGGLAAWQAAQLPLVKGK